jgi:hypothetical protein
MSTKGNIFSPLPRCSSLQPEHQVAAYGEILFWWLAPIGTLDDNQVLLERSVGYGEAPKVQIVPDIYVQFTAFLFCTIRFVGFSKHGHQTFGLNVSSNRQDHTAMRNTGHKTLGICEL